MHKIVENKGIIYIIGGLSKYGNKESKGVDSYLSIRQSIIQLDKASDISEILLYVDSPGGSIDGLFDTCNQLANINKPTSAFITGMGCSAAFILASQCQSIAVESDAVIGSVGVMRILEDSSKAAELAGIKSVVVASGYKKGRLFPNSELSNEDIASVKKQVDYFAEKAFNIVKQGRKNMTDKQLEFIKSGDQYNAEDAIDLDLIDSITSYSAFLAGSVSKSEYKAQAVDVKEEDEKEDGQSEPVAEDTTVEDAPVEDAKDKIIDDLKKEIEMLKEKLNKPLEDEDNGVAEDVAVEDEDEDEKDKESMEATAVDSLNKKADIGIVGLYLLACDNDADFAVKAMKDGLTVGEAGDKYLQKMDVANLKAFTDSKAHNSFDKIYNTVRKYCASDADAKAYANYLIDNNKTI